REVDRWRSRRQTEPSAGKASPRCNMGYLHDHADGGLIQRSVRRATHPSRVAVQRYVSYAVRDRSAWRVREESPLSIWPTISRRLDVRRPGGYRPPETVRWFTKRNGGRGRQALSGGERCLGGGPAREPHTSSL